MTTSIYWQFQLFRTIVGTDHILLGRLNILRLKALEATLGDVDIGDEGVELVHRVLVLVPQPGEADAHAEGNAPDTLSRENEKVLEFRDEVTRRSPGPRWLC